MIGYIKGKLIAKSPPMLVIDVGGVGYEIEAPMTTFYELPEHGKAVTLHTHFVVREDAQLLYGFIAMQDRDLFRHLLRVNGIGPRMGLAVLSTLTPTELLECVSNNDILTLTRVPGVGKKTAERLLLDLRDRLDQFEVPATAGNGKTTGTGGNESRDAISALMALGYKQTEAARAVKSIGANQTRTEDLIREALQFLAS